MDTKIICPYCGHEYSPEDPTDYVDSISSREECRKCEKEFRVSADVIVYYSVAKYGD